MLDALRKQGIPAAGIDIAKPLPPDLAAVDGTGRAPLILHVNAPELPRVLMRLPRALRENRRVIGYWAWELPTVPRAWLYARACVHDVWCPSRFTAGALAAACDQRPTVVRHPLAAADLAVAQVDRSAFGLPADAVIVLVSFSLASSFERKNPLGSIAAFRAAFGMRMDRILVLKVGHVAAYEDDLAAIRTAIADAPNIRLDTTLYPGPESRALIGAADIVLALHRSEGFGLVVAEAMMLGRCVIASDWSATAEFLDADCGLPVPVRTIRARDPRGVFEAPGAVWADPDLDEAARLLRIAADDPGLRRRLGSAAQARARAVFDGADLRGALPGIDVGAAQPDRDRPKPRRVLIWQWGRRGGGPRFAVDLFEGLRAVPGVQPLLSLSDRAEVLSQIGPGDCALTVPTYDGAAQFLARLFHAPSMVSWLARRIAALRPDMAICAMPGLIDLLMASALRRIGVKIVVIVHDAMRHPGDGLPLQMTLQRLLVSRADVVVALSAHVARQLHSQRLLMRGRVPLVATLPPFAASDVQAPPPFAHGGAPRILMFGRLLPYKGIDLLGPALTLLRGHHSFECRVVGSGPPSLALDILAGLPGVHVENTWVPEDAIQQTVAWADVVVLPYREASQSGVGAVALASGRHVVATAVGGLVEQFRDAPHAVLCAPDAAAIARALGDVLDAPPELPAPIDQAAMWREMATDLMARIEKVLDR